jgi:hypothetical protein
MRREDEMSDAQHYLYKETQAAKALRENLADILELDEETGRDMVEAETGLFEAIDRVVQLMVDDKAAIHGLDEMIGKLQSRKDRIEARMLNARTALYAAMEQAGKSRIDHPAVTLTVRAVAPSATIIDEAAVPSKFWRTFDPKIDKRAVLAALKAKEDVPGATLSNGGSTVAFRWE